MRVRSKIQECSCFYLARRRSNLAKVPIRLVQVIQFAQVLFLYLLQLLT